MLCSGVGIQDTNRETYHSNMVKIVWCVHTISLVFTDVGTSHRLLDSVRFKYTSLVPEGNLVLLQMLTAVGTKNLL